MSATTTISTMASHRAYSVHNSCRSLKNLSYHYGSSGAFLGNRDHLSLRMCRRVQYSCTTKSNGNKNGSSVCITASSGPPSSSWKHWVLGTLLSIILPFWRHKWVPVLALKKVEMVVETIDAVTEMVEKVAEGVEKVADEVADRLPDGGKLQQAVCLFEQVAKKVAEEAHAADEFIHKVEEVEKEIEKEVEKEVEKEIEKEVETIVEGVIEEKIEESKEASSNNESNQ